MLDQMKSNTDQEKQFFDAIRSGDIERMHDFVTKNPELLNAYDYDCFGATPLTSVAFKDDREMVAALLELGADPDRRSDWDMGPWCPLHSAIHNNQNELARYLLQQGAELDAHTAAALGMIDELKQLLDNSPARVSERGGDGCTPLHFAGSEAAIDMLLDYGADMEARCIDHYSTPVQYVAGRQPAVARYLLGKGAVADIFSAALCGATETVQRLIDTDSSILDQTISQDTFPPGPEHDVHNIMTFTVGHGCSPLHAAASGDQPDTIQLLIQRGMDPNVRGGYDDATPLHLAAWNDHHAAARALIENGADINLRSGKLHNNSAAGWAIVAGSADVFCLLLENGCEILGFFADDAQAAVNGKFRQYKVAAQENYQRIRDAIQTP